MIKALCLYERKKEKERKKLKFRWKLTAENKENKATERFLHVYHCHNQQLLM